jgi:hypothetical protein
MAQKALKQSRPHRIPNLGSNQSVIAAAFRSIHRHTLLYLVPRRRCKILLEPIESQGPPRHFQVINLRMLPTLVQITFYRLSPLMAGPTPLAVL